MNPALMNTTSTASSANPASSPTSGPTLDTFRAVIADDMQAVNTVIRTRLASEVVLINQIAQYIIDAGGKRLRPALVVLAGSAAGAPKAYLHEMAAVVDLFTPRPCCMMMWSMNPICGVVAIPRTPFLAMLPVCWWGIFFTPAPSR